LPLQHVVVYRNGVAYFERAGHVSADAVHFKMQRAKIGDFLATLAVTERGGSAVRAAALPLQDDAGEDAARDLQTVTLALDGKGHDVQVGYVTEAPLWKPSYRMVVHPGGQAELEAWGVVQNVSGEDWRDVRLSLASGAPIAFEADLGTAVIPSRPFVADPGQRNGSVPRGETSFAGASSPENGATVHAPVIDTGSSSVSTSVSTSVRGSANRSFESVTADAVAVSAGSPGSAPRNVRPAPARFTPRRPVGTLTVQGASTRYDVASLVSVPDQSTTMVMFLARPVAGEASYFYSPDPGIPDSGTHPFRVARFKNDTGGTLEPGPITVLGEGAFLGQGLLDVVPSGATATVPFALEGGIVVTRNRDPRSEETGARIAKIENGELTVERDAVTRTTYKMQNGADEAAVVRVRHDRAPGTRLFGPPAGTEDRLGSGDALVPISVPAHAAADLVVDERAPGRKPCDWMSALADEAVRAYLADPHADPAVAKALSAAWNIREQYQRLANERDSLRLQAQTLSQSTDEERKNMRSIEKSAGVDALRQKIAADFAKASARLAELTQKAATRDAELPELRRRFHDAVAGIAFVALPATAGTR
jgi:hypothetical protein